MHKYDTEILVIGGGATGTGIVRDLTLRGFKTMLVERRDLADGTTGRYHGLLHSGARYAVKDLAAAHECIKENRILRQIMPQCIEDTGGFFVVTPEDDPNYAIHLISGCQQAGIPIEEVSLTQMLREESSLNQQITRCLRVPDGAADSFLATRLNTHSAKAHGAKILRYHPVKELIFNTASRVSGAICHDLVKDEEVQISADLVINAAGAWVGKIAALAGITVQMLPGKGIMLATNHRIVNTVINRCKMPGDGDILVPAHTVAVIGTTDVKVADPDHFGIEAWEVNLMLAEGEKIIPGFSQMRFLRAWAGVRPLYQESQNPPDSSANRDITRSFALLDHSSRDGIIGLLTITGGKWTTYRMMAEIASDQVCKLLNTKRECRTHLEKLPTKTQSKGQYLLGHKLAEIEQEKAHGQLVCECELATLDDVRQAIGEGEAYTLDDIRREVRLGKGPCQACFCTLRTAGILHEERSHNRDTLTTNTALVDFLQERWKGVRPVLWGQQLRQERLNELIYINLLNVGALLKTDDSPLASVDYQLPEPIPAQQKKVPQRIRSVDESQSAFFPQADVIVIGMGLAGLFAAWLCAEQGMKVKLIGEGASITHWTSGCIDVLGHTLQNYQETISSPQTILESFTIEQEKHPYIYLSQDTLNAAIRKLQALCQQENYPLPGNLQRNWLLPTATGTLRPTCLAPVTMIAGDVQQTMPLLIVGFEKFVDFSADFVADNLNIQGIEARAVTINLPTLQKQRLVNSLSLARIFDRSNFHQEFIQAMSPHIQDSQRIGIPAVLGLKHASETHAELQKQLDLPIFEIPGLPPSIPGVRLYNLLRSAICRAGGQILDGMKVIGGQEMDGKLIAVECEAAARKTTHLGQYFILATDGILGGGITTQKDGLVYESTLGLPIQAPQNRLDWTQPHFLAPEGQPIFQAGLTVDEAFRPLDTFDKIYYENLYAIGDLLNGCDPIRECSLEGICLASAWKVVEEISQSKEFHQRLAKRKDSPHTSHTE